MKSDTEKKLRHHSSRLRALLLRFVAVCVFFTLGLHAPCRVSGEEFTRAQSGYTWSFPRDHGHHPHYQTEWWYYTGQLYGENQEPFRDKPQYGFQLTFFRRTESLSNGAASEYMAHAAITDMAAGTTYFSSRIGGGALGIATTSPDSLAAVSGDWTVDPMGEDLTLRFALPSAGQQKPLEIRIRTAELPLVWFQGDNGMSQKASCDGCASMYYSMPRIDVQARLVSGEGQRDLRGIAWMDHEFMTNSLGKSQVGWDWFGLMLKDGRSLMLFQLRNDSGGKDFSSGGIRSGETIRALRENEFELAPLEYWRSPTSGAKYPIAWRVKVPKDGIDVIVKARVEQCEIGSSSHGSAGDKASVRYWEGPVATADESVLGYLEMTGYGGTIGRF